MSLVHKECLGAFDANSVGEDSLRVTWTARRLDQSILQEINLDCLFDGHAEVQIIGHLRKDCLEKT